MAPTLLLTALVGALLPLAPAAQEAAETPGVLEANPLARRLNLGFEEADHLQGWFAGGEGYAATVDIVEKHSGLRSLQITYERPGSFGVATNTFPTPDLAKARGGRLRFSGHLKTRDVAGGGAGLWMRVDGPAGILAFDNMQRRSVTGTTGWARYEIVLHIAEEATNINFGAMLSGQGTAWVDSLDFELLPPAEPAPAITVRGIVRDAEGRTVSGAHIALVHPHLPRAEARGRSGEDGRFAVEVAAGEYGITATAAGPTSASLAPRVLAPDQELEIGLGDEGVTLSGAVTDDVARPVVGLTVQLIRVGEDGGDLFQTETDGEGRYAATVRTGKEYSLVVHSDDYVSGRHTASSHADQTIDIPVVPSGPAPALVIEWIRANAIPLKTPEAGHGLEDMQPLREVVGDARVVGLGEATHGSREFFQLKHRMLEFLVEEMDFTVFAIEANWPESLAIDEYVLHGRGNPREGLAGIYFWTWNTEEVLALIEWMRRYNADPAHGTKVRFFGFDMQTPRIAVERVLEYVRKAAPETIGVAEASLALVRGRRNGVGLDKLPKPERDAIENGIESLLKRFDAHRRDYVGRTSEREWVLARQHLVIVQQAVAAGAGGQSSDLRDESMAANIQWILDTEPPGTKVVAWAHNAHVSRHGESGMRPMGSHLAETLGDDYVVLGFAFNRGSFQAKDWTEGQARTKGVREHTVGPAPPGTIGAAFATAGMPVFALDLRARPGGPPVPAWFTIPHPMREIGAVFWGEESMSAPVVLTDHYDGVLFVEETTRAVPVKAAPPKEPGGI